MSSIIGILGQLATSNFHELKESSIATCTVRVKATIQLSRIKKTRHLHELSVGKRASMDVYPISHIAKIAEF